MTREEAIKILRREIECLSHTKCEDCILEAGCNPIKTTPYDSEYIEVYEMAITALEQERCGDVISRQAVKEQMIKYGFHAPDMTVTEFVEDLPSVNPQKSCEDAISRQAVLKQTYDWSKDEFLRDTTPFDYLRKRINDIPPVNPQEPKTGHWIFDEILDNHYYCSECKSMGVDYWDFCPYCGTKMVESQESEDEK